MDVLDSGPPRAIGLLLRAEMPSISEGEGTFAAAAFKLPDILPLDAAPPPAPLQAQEEASPPPLPEADGAQAEDTAIAQPPPLGYPAQRYAVILRLSPPPRHPDVESDPHDAALQANLGVPSAPSVAPHDAAAASPPQTVQVSERATAQRAIQGPAEPSGRKAPKIAQTSANSGPSALPASDMIVEAGADPPADPTQGPRVEAEAPAASAPQHPPEDPVENSPISLFTPVTRAPLADALSPRPSTRDIGPPNAGTQGVRPAASLDTTLPALQVKSTFPVVIEPMGVNRHAVLPPSPQETPSPPESGWHGPGAPSAQHTATSLQSQWQDPGAPSGHHTATSPQSHWQDRSAPPTQQAATPSPTTRPMPELRAELDTRSGEVALEIAPDDLGALRIILRPEGETLRIALQASREEGVEFLRKNSSTLEGSLEDSGFRHHSFTFEDWHEADPDSDGDVRTRDDTAPETSDTDRRSLALGGRALNLRL